MVGINRSTRTVVLALLGVTAAIFAAFVIAFATHRFVVPVPGLKEWVDIGAEGSLPAWWNSLLLMIAALLAMAGAVLSRERSAERRGWSVIAVAATYLSIDEATALHERLRAITEIAGIDSLSYAWVLPGSVVGVIESLILIRAGRALPPHVGARLGMALGLYALGALGFEALGGLIRNQWGHSWLFSAVLTIEEGLEVLACIVAVGAIIDHLAIRRAGLGLMIGDRPSTAGS